MEPAGYWNSVYSGAISYPRTLAALFNIAVELFFPREINSDIHVWKHLPVDEI